jgi:fatty acid/phospholipid biosynthesis enzyme
MRIVLDAMGSDTHPNPEILAAIEASNRWGDTTLLVGPEDLLLPMLDSHEASKAVRPPTPWLWAWSW